MKIDLHIHTSTGSDGALSVEEVFKEARKRNVDLISITDHDSIDCQERAIALAKEYGIIYITGIELNVTFRYPDDGVGKGGNHPGRQAENSIAARSVSLDFLGYHYDIGNQALKNRLQLLKEHREARARQILEKLNIEFDKENIPRFTEDDIRNIQDSVDGVFCRPHIADYLIKKGIVQNRQEAFDRYLVRCDVPKYPLSLSEVSGLVRNAGGLLVHAHPGDPKGTSLASIRDDLEEQTSIIEEYMLEYIDGVECWHSGHDAKTTTHYIEFARKHGLLLTGGSDCHQKPLLLGTMDIPDYVAEQFRR